LKPSLTGLDRRSDKHDSRREPTSCGVPCDHLPPPPLGPASRRHHFRPGSIVKLRSRYRPRERLGTSAALLVGGVVSFRGCASHGATHQPSSSLATTQHSVLPILPRAALSSVNSLACISRSPAVRRLPASPAALYRGLSLVANCRKQRKLHSRRVPPTDPRTHAGASDCDREGAGPSSPRRSIACPSRWMRDGSSAPRFWKMLSTCLSVVLDNVIYSDESPTSLNVRTRLTRPSLLRLVSLFISRPGHPPPPPNSFSLAGFRSSIITIMHHVV